VYTVKIFIHIFIHITRKHQII